ncbi:MAG TPA: DedA family protein [Paracoccaceae bacterium]|nr:DedA family protein [Paracoccaceae bacterium]
MSEWIAEVITGWGMLGVAFLMFLEHLFPPLPSEVILPLAGIEAARRDLSPVWMILAGTLGSVAGLSVWFVAALLFGKERLLALVRRFGRILTVRPEEIGRLEVWFGRWGDVAVLVGRLIPTVRTLISVPAGFARMPVRTFLIYSTAGSLVWTAFLILAGVWLGAQGGIIERWIGPVSDVVLIGIVVTYLYRLVTYRA